MFSFNKVLTLLTCLTLGLGGLTLGFRDLIRIVLIFNYIGSSYKTNTVFEYE